MTQCYTDPFTMPYEAAESLTIAYLKRQLVWMEEEVGKEPVFEADRDDLRKDIRAVRHVLWWMTGETHYEDQPHDFHVGTRVHKVKGYSWPGVVVSAFNTLEGKPRYVVECTVPEVAGALHIYNADQLEIPDAG